MSSTTVADAPPIQGRHLEAGETFRFECRKDLPCFTRCCADVTIVLTPLDVLRLARRLELSTTDFLERHAHVTWSSDLGLPVVLLRMTDSEDRSCPFVSEDGCSVYDERPWACRMYPLAMALPPVRAGQVPEPVFTLLEDGWCEGRGCGPEWTVDTWREDQNVLEQELVEKGFRDLVGHPWFIGGRRLDERRARVMLMACYDLDRFREMVFETSFLQRFEIPPETAAEMARDDLALLDFAFRWLRFALFGEPTIAVRAHRPGIRRRA